MAIILLLWLLSFYFFFSFSTECRRSLYNCTKSSLVFTCFLCYCCNDVRHSVKRVYFGREPTFCMCVSEDRAQSEYNDTVHRDPWRKRQPTRSGIGYHRDVKIQEMTLAILLAGTRAQRHFKMICVLPRRSFVLVYHSWSLFV